MPPATQTAAYAGSPVTPSWTARRRLMAAAVGVTILAMVLLMALSLSPGGLVALEWVLLGCFALTLPWTVVGFWNATLGLMLMARGAAGWRSVHQGLPVVDPAAPLDSSTALLVCIRNEDAEAVARRLDLMLDGLVEAGVAGHFHAYVLSDSNRDSLNAREAKVFRRLGQRWHGLLPVTYRRRERNPGFKAGNIRDFCERWGAQHDFALVLDADSLMSPAAILRLVRTMQADERLGILQSLVTGMPSASAFARPFQFGMRLGMRSFTLGSAWWQGDCGPYWGHNALIRLAPFIAHCELPQLPGGPPLGGWILSHDQVEAVLMRRAGYAVRVLPEEGGSWEQNPPNLLEFIRRDLRWCQGNMQYFRLLTLPGLRPVSRVQLALAILMFLSSPAWILFMSLGVLQVGLAFGSGQTFHPVAGPALFAVIMTMVFAPKLATLAESLASASRRRAFGGAPLMLVGVITEVLFATLLAPVMALAHTLFLLQLPWSRRAEWSAQQREVCGVGLREAAQRLWVIGLFGVLGLVFLGVSAPQALPFFLPFLLGPLLAVPIATLSADARLGQLLTRWGLWRIPDETAPAPILSALPLPALAHRHRPVATTEPLPGGSTLE